MPQCNGSFWNKLTKLQISNIMTIVIIQVIMEICHALNTFPDHGMVVEQFIIHIYCPPQVPLENLDLNTYFKKFITILKIMNFS